ncbi:MAG: hypothetical protein ACXABY_03695 [Candidatus Thorarchaeota archaeon]|jgi:hypothetical protein
MDKPKVYCVEDMWEDDYTTYITLFFTEEEAYKYAAQTVMETFEVENDYIEGIENLWNTNDYRGVVAAFNQYCDNIGIVQSVIVRKRTIQGTLPTNSSWWTIWMS